MDRVFSKINESLSSDSGTAWDIISEKVSKRALERSRRSIGKPIMQTSSVLGSSSLRQTSSVKGSPPARETFSVKGSPSIRQTFSSKGSPPARETFSSTGTFLTSPYDTLQKCRRYKKIYPNRVHVAWYKKYVDIPNDNELDFQPFDEVQKVEEDIAMQYFFGMDGHLIDPRDQQMNERRQMVLKKFSTIREQEMVRAHVKANDKKFKLYVRQSRSGKGNRKQSMIQKELAFGSSACQKKIYAPIIDFLNKIQNRKIRALRKIILKPHSKWRLLNKLSNKNKLAVMYKQHQKEQIRHHFRKVIRLIVAVVRFIETVRLITGDAKRHFREAEAFRARQEQEKLKVQKMGKRMFNVQKYKLTKKLNISASAKMTLTKPWFRRVKSEIDEVVDLLQSYKSFVEYPPVFQRRLATLAWYIEVEQDKYIIRERHIASDFYILLMGKAKVTKFVGDPCLDIGGHFEFVRYIKKSESFGDECMTNPQSSRDYSVISCERCSMLSINFHDYLQMLTTPKDNEFATEHVIFLSHLKFLENFPKTQLMEEVDGNISIHYFRPRALITQNLANSEYIFVVLNGSCRLISPMFRFEEMLDEGYQIEPVEQCLPTPSRGPSIQSSVESEESTVDRIIAERDIAHLPRYFMQVRERARSLGHELRHICLPESALINEYRDKITATCDTLPSADGNFFLTENYPQLVDMKEIFQPPSDSAYTEGKNLLNSTLSGHISAFASPSGIFDARSKRSSEMCYRDRKDDLAKSLAGYIDVLTTHTTSLHRVTTRQFSTPRDQQSRTSQLNLRERKKDLAKSFSGLDDIFSTQSDSVHGMALHSEGQSTTVLPQSFVEQSEQETTISQRVLAKSLQKWKLIRTMVRGDAVGQEYLDYNEGPFTAPVGMISVVSDGCEIIMIKRTLLLKYLRKEW